MLDLGSVIGAVFQGLPFVLALALGFTVPILLVCLGVVSRRFPTSTRLAWLLGLMILGSAVMVAASGRVLLSEAEAALRQLQGLGEEGSPWGSRVSQVFTALILLVAGSEVCNWALAGARPKGRAGRLWAFAMVYFLCAIVLSGIAGVFRNPRLNDIYAPLVLTAIALLADGADASMWRRLRWPLLVTSAGSLLAIVALPKVAMLPDFQASLIPGIKFRLYGLSDHANSLGIFAAAALVLELAPFVRKHPAWPVLLCHLAVLLLTQSKTAWIGGLIGVLVIRWLWVKDIVFRNRPRDMAMVSVIAACFALSFAAVGLVILAESPKVARLLDRIGAFTFTGRTMIWQVTMNEFYASPITGYGPSLWDLPYRMQHGMMQAGQAHNQFIQILGQAGLLGLLSMLAYLGAMTIYALKGIARDGGWALALILMLVIRCLSESPLRLGTVLGADWIHFGAFAAAAGLAASHSEPWAEKVKS